MPVGGRKIERRNLVLSNPVKKTRGGQRNLLAPRNHASPRKPRRQNLFDRNIEADGCELKHALRRSQPVQLNRRNPMIYQPAVRKLHSAWRSCRAGGINQISKTSGSRSRLKIFTTLTGQASRNRIKINHFRLRLSNS